MCSRSSLQKTCVYAADTRIPRSERISLSPGFPYRSAGRCGRSPASQDLQPLKVQKVAVTVLQDYGSIWTRDGQLQLTKDARLFMWSDDVQQLVREGARSESRRITANLGESWRIAANHSGEPPLHSGGCVQMRRSGVVVRCARFSMMVSS